MADHEAIFRAHWRRHQPSLLRFLRARVGWNDADDLAQQVWVEMAPRLAPGELAEDDVRKLLFTVAHRRVIDEYRRRERRAVPSDHLPDGVHHDVDRLGDELSRLLDCVADLAPDQADAVLLRILGDLPFGDVAAIMQRSEGAVRVLVHRGLHRLAELARAAGVTTQVSASMKGAQ